MKLSRRELPLLLPALSVAGGDAQAAVPNALPSMAVRYEDMTARPSGTMVARQILKGLTHAGVELDLHETELAPGQAPHPPHQHVHEELLLIREGQMEVTLDGRATRIGPGSVTYVASNQLHGWKNAGTTPARYFVLAVGNDKP